MKETAAIVVLLGALAAGCSQSTSQTAQTQAAMAPPAKAQPRAGTQAQRCEEAARKAAQAGQNAAMAGTLLSAVGSFGGLAGRGGAIAGHAASVGGSMMQQQAQNNAQNAMMEECG
ncbi:hypothetical protein [Arvimicrobium flavum]|uniref:hypothetical protein n=1 Tax=Arvimicrobium flavum TaxID=3393320 RepID=UPI00237B2B1D|nr:hypothetical protein [Mesorhizobium shangrilense]